MQATRASAWNTQELHTWYQKHLHALKIGEHRDRIRSNGISKGVDNSTPRHYYTYLKSKYGADSQQYKSHKKKSKNNNHNRNTNRNRNNTSNNNKPSNRQRSKSQFTTPNHNNNHVRMPFQEKARKIAINKQNMLLKSRINNMQPSKCLTQELMTEHWKRHSQYRNKFLSNRDKVRQYPDVLSKQKLLKSLSNLQSQSSTNVATCNQSPNKQNSQQSNQSNQSNHCNDNDTNTATLTTPNPTATISSNSVLNVKYSDIMSIQKRKKMKSKSQKKLHKSESQPTKTQIIPRKHNSDTKTRLPALQSPNAKKKPNKRKKKVIESTKDI